MFIENNAFADKSLITKHLILVSRSPTELIFKEINTQRGVPYGETFETHAKWEFLAPHKDSDKVIVQHSYKIEWLKKPFLIAGIIKDHHKRRMKKTMPITSDWYLDRAIDYKNTLMIK